MKTIGLISANYGSSEFGELLENRTLASLPYGDTGSSILHFQTWQTQALLLSA